MFIGEGPGRDEDLQGRPFVGRAGVLLTAIIEKGMLVEREEVFIANVVKCRPTIDLAFERDRPPDDEGTAACGGFLKKQIEIIAPEVIVTLGVIPPPNSFWELKRESPRCTGSGFRITASP